MNPQISRLMIIFGVLISLFMVTRWVAQPQSFYQYGHYRGNALSEVAARPESYVARDKCAECHEDEGKQNAAGPHVKISCQSCHGPGHAHVEDPAVSNIIKPTVGVICVRCHGINKARPANFPQVNAREHAEGKVCSKCHTVHNPGDIKTEDAPKDSLTAEVVK